MAFRFRREGDHLKHKMHLERTGMQPWVEDFKWRVMDWHYNYYMGPKARNAILSNQGAAKHVQDMYEKKSHGFVRRKKMSEKFEARRTQFFAHTTCLPNVTPHRRSSNPFCPVTPNKTGWKEYVEQIHVRGADRPRGPWSEDAQHRRQYIMDPKPKGPKHVIAGTDDTVPIMPNQD
eukprot:TRINITY_DN97553_c0_g1_i1.p2 TRINITY_DN97553_c0_g1~~TRINITY_DN97553_c0_g1_i1.p2  ORF type:complete len:176 (-),score=29.80 TRINITY_DN97553_c0_g1_i1:107-634(-)